MSWMQWQKSMKKLQLKYQMVNWRNVLQRIKNYCVNTRVVECPILHLDYVKHVTGKWVTSSACMTFVFYLITYSYHLLFYWLLQFDTLSGGLDGGLDPPAFQHAERVRMIKSHSEENANKSDDVSTTSTKAQTSDMLIPFQVLIRFLGTIVLDECSLDKVSTKCLEGVSVWHVLVSDTRTTPIHVVTFNHLYFLKLLSLSAC